MPRRGAPRRETQERPYRCQLCGDALAENELGYVCEHIAHGAWLTLLADPEHVGVIGQPFPDTACTACGQAMEAKKKNAEAKANIHIICRPCYRNARAQNIDYFTKADVDRGYVLVPRAHYDRVVKREIKLDVGAIVVGRELKLGFSPIPCMHPVSLERMWVRVSCVLKGGVIHGSLANDPELFKRRILKADDTVVFKAAHVLETDPPKPKRTSEPRAKKPANKKLANKKPANKKLANKQKGDKRRRTRS